MKRKSISLWYLTILLPTNPLLTLSAQPQQPVRGQTNVILANPESPCNMTEPECHPSSPHCLIFANNETRLVLPLPTNPQDPNYLDYRRTVIPEIEKHRLTHESGNPDYVLPLDFLWNATGLGKYLSTPPKSGAGACALPIYFKRSPTYHNEASFNWSGAIQPLTGGAALLSLQLQIPGTLNGRSSVGPFFSEFYFFGSGPHLKISAATGVIFEDDISCFSVTTTGVTIRRKNGHGEDAAHANIQILPN